MTRLDGMLEARNVTSRSRTTTRLEVWVSRIENEKCNQNQDDGSRIESWSDGGCNDVVDVDVVVEEKRDGKEETRNTQLLGLRGKERGMMRREEKVLHLRRDRGGVLAFLGVEALTSSENTTKGSCLAVEPKDPR